METITLEEEIATIVTEQEPFFVDLNDVKPAEWIIEGLVKEQGLNWLYGGIEEGKTTLVLQTIAAMIEGQTELFCLKIKPVPWLFIEQDESPSVFRSHRDRILDELPSLNPFPFPTCYVYWTPKEEKLVNLVELIRERKKVTGDGMLLVVIDSFTSLGIPDLNHPNTSQILDYLRRVTVEEDVAFWIIHHLNRSQKILGSILLQIKADCMVRLDSKGLHFDKKRGAISISSDILPIGRVKPSILFRLSMINRAAVLKEQKIGRDEAIQRLMDEYGVTRDNARTTWNKEQKKLSPNVIVKTIGLET